MAAVVGILEELTETQVIQLQLAPDDLRALSVQPDETAEPGGGQVEPAKCDQNYIRCDKGYESSPS